MEPILLAMILGWTVLASGSVSLLLRTPVVKTFRLSVTTLKRVLFSFQILVKSPWI
jgi:hypothetical protein